VLALYQGDEVAAGTWLEQAAALGQVVGDRRTVANALSSLGVMMLGQGDLTRAGARLEESLALMREVGERRGIATVLTNQGIVAYNQGSMERAATVFAEALAASCEVGDRDLVATNLANLSSVTLYQGVLQGRRRWDVRPWRCTENWSIRVDARWAWKDLLARQGWPGRESERHGCSGRQRH
jgi:hypothetical protein